MGRGNADLGSKLMNTFLNVINEVTPTSKTVVLFNSGVKLCCEGSPVLEHMQDLVEKGVTLLNCGTCLNYFELNGKLKAGKESNMVEITETMLNADLIIPL